MQNDDGICTLQPAFKLKIAGCLWKPQFSFPMIKLRTEVSENERLREQLGVQQVEIDELKGKLAALERKLKKKRRHFRYRTRSLLA